MRCCASRVTTGPISLSLSRPLPTLTARARSLTASTMRSPASPTATAAEIAMQRSPAEPKAAAARWSAAKSMSASGRMIAWFLAPPRACTRLPFAVPRSWMYFAIGVEPTNETAATSGESRIVSTASLSPCTTLKTPSGRPGLLPHLRDQHRGGGVPLAGLEHEGVAAGDRHREHPHRHHRREVERRDAGDHAQRLAEGVGVDVGRDLVGVVTLEQARDAAGELDDLEPALHLAQRVGEHLAVLVGDQLGDLRRHGR